MIYSLTRFIGWVAFKLLWGYYVTGAENVPKKGGLILVCNHSSYLDPPFVAMATFRRKLNFMARDSLFRHWLFGWYISALKAFPVRRGGADRGAWRDFQRMVDNGETVLFFPEGTRTPDGKLQTANPGSGMLIHRCKGATVLPVRIFGAYELWPKGKSMQGLKPIGVTFGKPLDLSAEMNQPGGRETYAAIIDKVMAGIGELKPSEKYSAPLPAEAEEGAKAP